MLGALFSRDTPIRQEGEGKQPWAESWELRQVQSLSCARLSWDTACISDTEYPPLVK